jgi:ABC-type sugar transport system ATPase subunit
MHGAQEGNNRRPTLEVRGLAKRFGNVAALRSASLSVDRGQVVALVGDNGAGKSTLVKTVAGVHQPDNGSIWLEGRLILFRNPREALDAGVEVVYQDLSLAPDLNVWSNIFLNREERSSGVGRWIGWMDKNLMRERSVSLLNDLEIEVPDVEAPVMALSGGQRQAVAVARGVAWGRRLLIMDEPTNNLGVVEQSHVLGLVKMLRQKGLAILLISHNLAHVFEVADRVVVLRNGRTIADANMADVTPDRVVAWITGSGSTTEFEP